MPDYDLQRLNHRSFEQLIQALGIAILGPQLTIFGDGPDGGREATFQNTVTYPSGGRRWNGHGIVQAKFRQVLDSSPKRNADWAIKQLKGEFKKLSPRKPKASRRNKTTRRPAPDYYVFATNISLSATETSGGKDRVSAALLSFKKSHGLKDFAIWDGAQIHRFLDGQPSIRQTYAAWLEPGDVLSLIIDALQLRSGSFQSTVRRYLESELLDDQFAHLTQGGYTEAKGIPLGSVFVDLPVELHPHTRNPSKSRYHRRPAADSEDSEDSTDESRQSRPTFLRVLLDEAQQVHRPSVRTRASTDDESAGRLVLVGGPGQGKTTAGQFACQLLRAALLEASNAPSSPEVSQALTRIKESREGLPAIGSRRYPLRVDLKHLAASLASVGTDHVDSLFEYLVRRISTRTNSVINSSEFRVWLKGYPWLLVLDGLDEVPASSNRQQLVQAVRDFISVESHDADADLLVLATTRPQGYSEEFSPSLYSHLSLVPLDPSHALLYGSRLARARHPDQPSRIENLEGALRRATINPATARLMQSPLQVTIMLSLIEGGGEPPEQRWKLFHDYYEVIYRREKERNTYFSTILGRYEPDIHWLHHRAGWLLQQRNAGAGATNSRFTHTEFEALVDGRLRSVGHDDPSSRHSLVISIRTAATDRLVFLVGNTDREIGFEIRSLQEFMAAEHIFDGSEQCIKTTISSIAPFAYWRNVVLFASGRIFFERQDLIPNIISTCAEMNESTDDSVHRLVLAGSRLAADLIRDGSARNQPRWIRVLARTASRLLDALDSYTDEALANVFVAEAEEILRGELEERLAKSHLPSYNWILCLRLALARKPWAEELTIRQFPWVSQDLLMLFVRAGAGLHQLPERMLEKVVRDSESSALYMLPWLTRTAEDRASEKNRSLLSNQLSQFVSLVHHDISDYWPVLIDGKATDYGFWVRGEASLRAWSGLSFSGPLLETERGHWRIVRIIASFSQSPTLKNLSLALKQISEIYPVPGKTPDNWFYPWQFSVSIAAAKARGSWNAVLESVSSGSTGSEDEWKRWQQRGRRGIELSALHTHQDLRLSDTSLGHLIRQSSFMPRGNGSNGHALATAALDFLRSSSTSNNDQFVFDFACNVVIHEARGGNAVFDSLWALVSHCSQHRLKLPPELALVALLSTSTIENKIDMLATAGTCDFDLDRPAQLDEETLQLGDTIAAVLKGLSRVSRRAQILHAISLLPPVQALREIPAEYLMELGSLGGSYASAAQKLRILGLQWTEGESDEIARLVFELSQTDQTFPYSLFHYIRRTGARGPALERMLFQATRIGAHEVSEISSAAFDLLVKLVERRAASVSLPDPNWIYDCTLAPGLELERGRAAAAPSFGSTTS